MAGFADVADWFGFEIRRKHDAIDDQPQLDVEQNGSYVSTQAAASTYDFDFISATEVDLINSYRRISYMVEVNTAIRKIINELVILDEEKDVVSIETSKIVEENIFPKSVVDRIQDEFSQVIRMLDFNNQAHTLVRDWYVDSRIVYQKIIDPKRPSHGVQKLVRLDPRKIKRVEIVEDMKDGLLKVVDRFYVYMTSIQNGDMNNFNTQNIQMSMNDYQQFRRNVSFRVHEDAITYVDSGLIDRTSGISFGHLHVAVKIANQLDLVETSVIIYRLSRSAERRAVYIDAGNLPATKSRELLEATKADFKNKIYYDSVRGTIEDKARVMSLQEDFFMIRRNGKNATQIETLPSGQNLGQIGDVEYFLEKLYKALQVPLSRFRSEGGGLFSNKSEISRDELEFAEFVKGLRLQFSNVFYDILKTNLILKRIIRPEEWAAVKENIRFEFNRDNYFSELKEIEMLERRHQAFDVMKEQIGVYYSNRTARNKWLKQSQEEMDIEDKLIEEEKDTFIKRIQFQTFPSEEAAKARNLDADSRNKDADTETIDFDREHPEEDEQPIINLPKSKDGRT